MKPGHVLPMNRASRFLLGGLALLLLAPACAPETGKGNEELRREIKELKSEITALKTQVAQLQTGQQAILELLKKPAAPPPAALLPQPPGQLQTQPVPGMQPPPAPEPLTVSELLANKDKYLGTRVTIRGSVGPVLVHHKSLLLKAPEGMVEVFFGKLTDQKMVQYLTSATIEQSLTVSGVVNLPPKVGAAKLQINAETIEF